MYKNERIYIDTRIYNIDEIFERYKQGKLIFYEKNGIIGIHKREITQEVLEALSRGIPFPPVYVSELQTGELLVLDKSDRLRFLMEYLDHRFKINHTDYLMEELYRSFDFLKDIFYSSVILHVIDYRNPKYMHMQAGAFIEEWSATQEQGIRNILYQEDGISALEELAVGLCRAQRSRLSIEYRLIYFIMVHIVSFENFGWAKYENADKFQLLESTIFELKYMDSLLEELYSRFEYLYSFYDWQRQKSIEDGYPLHGSLETQTKYLCFLNIWMEIKGKNSLYQVFENKAIKKMMENCDMSYRGISRMMDNFERNIYD